MFPNYLGLISALLALAGFAWVHRQASRLALTARRRWFIASGLLSIPALYNAAYYLHVLPETGWFYEARAWPGVELLIIPAGFAGGLLASFLPRRVLIAPLLATVGITWGPFLKPVLAPIRSELRDTWTRDACIQSTLSTCGPASAATVLRSLGIRRGEAEIARSAHTYLGGTEAWYLACYLKHQQAIGVQFVLRPKGFANDLRLPAIVGVTVEGRGHFIAILERDGEWFRVGDPMIGPERLTQKMLETRYGFTGFALEVHKE